MIKKNKQLGVFLAVTLGYSLFYVCRLSLNVVKKSIVDTGYLDEIQLGIIGSALVFSYAIGKFVNGFLADRVNVRYFMEGGLLIASLVNCVLGFSVPFWAFVIFWAINGWFQSVGGPSSVIALNRWYGKKSRGTVYGLWSTSHNIGEAVTFIVVSFIVGKLGWQWGFFSASFLGFLGVILILLLLIPSPNNLGENIGAIDSKKSVGKKQLEVLANPAIWILALASGFMYISRYAVNSWGIYYFEAEKAYDLVAASSMVAISSVCGIVGTISSGFISDRVFKGSRFVPVITAGLMNVFSLVLFLYGPSECVVLDVISMILFGISIGVLIAFLGGLMAIDIAPKEAVGAAIGVVGIASYFAAGMQDIVSGFLIQSNKVMVDGVSVYDFSHIRIFWLGASILSVLLVLMIYYYQKKRIQK